MIEEWDLLGNRGNKRGLKAERDGDDFSSPKIISGLRFYS